MPSPNHLTLAKVQLPRSVPAVILKTTHLGIEICNGINLIAGGLVHCDTESLIDDDDYKCLVTVI